MQLCKGLWKARGVHGKGGGGWIHVQAEARGTWQR